MLEPGKLGSYQEPEPRQRGPGSEQRTQAGRHPQGLAQQPESGVSTVWDCGVLGILHCCDRGSLLPWHLRALARVQWCRVGTRVWGAGVWGVGVCRGTAGAGVMECGAGAAGCGMLGAWGMGCAGRGLQERVGGNGAGCTEQGCAGWGALGEVWGAGATPVPDLLGLHWFCC